MAKTPEQMMAMMVDGAQPHCDEPLRAAMVCSHAGSMSAALVSSISRFGGGLTRTSRLPNPVLIAVGPETVYAFKYKPKGFKVKLKSGSEVARWPRRNTEIEVDAPGKITTQFALVTGPDEVHPLEATTAMGGAGAFQLFVDSLSAPSS